MGRIRSKVSSAIDSLQTGQTVASAGTGLSQNSQRRTICQLTQTDVYQFVSVCVFKRIPVVPDFFFRSPHLEVFEQSCGIYNNEWDQGVPYAL